ncbi:hypothetical protein ACLMJK_007112 [Lecanora helva]
MSDDGASIALETLSPPSSEPVGNVAAHGKRPVLEGSVHGKAVGSASSKEADDDSVERDENRDYIGNDAGPSHAPTESRSLKGISKFFCEISLIDQANGNSYTKRIEELPPGYPQLAAFMCCAETFSIARRFSRLRMRRLAHYQCHLAGLERRLMNLDKTDFHSTPKALKSLSVKEPRDREQSREKLMDAIDMGLSGYDDLFHRTAKIMRFNSPSPRDRASFMEWFNTHKPLDQPDSKYLEPGDDFMTLAEDRECKWLDDFVEQVLDRCVPKRIMEASPESSKWTPIYYSHHILT